jgi:uncharacterized protein (TIGR02145 family)
MKTKFLFSTLLSLPKRDLRCASTFVPAEAGFGFAELHFVSVRRKLLNFYLLSFIFCIGTAQVPQGFNYQAIARDGSGNPIINTNLPVRITIQSDSLGGTTFWIEEHSGVTTNSFGLFNLILGKGVKKTGSTVATFNDIDWTITPKFIKTEIDYSGWKTMGSSRLWSVPYSMVSGSLAGPVKKLAVTGETSDMEEALFEVKNKNGQTVFAVYNEGVRIYVNDGVSKGVKGGFAIGGFGTAKNPSQNYFVVKPDTIRMYIDDTPGKAVKGGFAIGGFGTGKGTSQHLFVVNTDSIRAYIDTNTGKGVKGGFAIGGFGTGKAPGEQYLRVTRDSTRIYINDKAKAVKGGFAIGGFDNAKNADNEFFRVTTDSVKVSKSLLIPRLTTSERDNLPFTPGDALIVFNTTEGCMQIYKNNVWSNIWCFNCAPDFLIQPVDKIICSGTNVTFFISATGTNLNYQWEESTDHGNTWNNISNGGSNPAYSGAKGYTLTLTNIPVGHHNFKYRCVVAGSCLPNVTSNAVTLNVGLTPPIVALQPTDQQLSTGCAVSFSIVSPGYGVSYKWQQSDDGGNTWGNISDGGTSPVYSGSAVSTLSLSNVPKAYINYKYRCIVSNLCGADATSAAATLTLNTSPAISVQPVDKLVRVGQNITFDITTSGTGFNYQWQVSTNGGGTWSDITNGGSNPAYAGANTSSLSLSNVPYSYNNYKYRCALSHYCRPDAISDAAALTVPCVTDIDGNIYDILSIGTQIWMAENLKTTKFKDGSAIPNVLDNTSWSTLTTASYCWYDNNEVSYKNTYGALYNWYAVNTGNLCPTGWHVPDKGEWTTLEIYLINNGYNYDGSTTGNKIGKALASTTLWTSSTTTGAVGNTDYPAKRNSTGFKALPGGYRSSTGIFSKIGNEGYWWSSLEYDASTAYERDFPYSSPSGILEWHYSMKYGESVRCIKD